MTIRITGAFTYDRKDEIDLLVSRLIGSTDTTLDLSEVNEIDTFGISVLVALSKTIAEQYRNLEIHGDEAIAHFARIAGVEHLIELIDAA